MTDTPATEGESSADLPSVEAVTQAGLSAAPEWFRRAVSNGVVLLGWIGLPSTIISTLSQMRWVIDAGLWLYRHSGALKPYALQAGQGLSWLVHLWQSLTHPIWQALADRLHVVLPSWAPDVLTLVAIIVAGMIRRWLRASWGHQISGAHMYRATQPGFGPSEEYIPIPRHFPFADYFGDNYVRWTPRKLADAERLWRKWRRSQIGVQLTADGSRWPRFHKSAIRAQFGRFYLSIMDGRRDLAMYAIAATILLLTLILDALLRWRGII